MRKSERIRRATADELRQQLAAGEDKSDWRRVKAMAQTEVEQLADAEDGPLPEGWENTIELGLPAPKAAVHIRLDQEVLRWFKAHGPGYQTRINAVLRAFVQARQRHEHKAE